MSCWRNDVLKKDRRFYCQEMEARVVGLENGGETCFCLGVIDSDYRDDDNSKRVCMVDNIENGLDIAVDLTDVDIAALQSTLSGGMLAIYQRARTINI